MDSIKLKKVAWTAKFEEHKLIGIIGRRGTNEDAVKLGIAYLVKTNRLHPRSRVAPGDVEQSKARDWLTAKPDGSLLIDEITVRVMEKARLAYPQISNGDLLPINLPSVPWTTLYGKAHGTCLHETGIRPSHALARVYGNQIFGWNPGQILPEYFQTTGQGRELNKDYKLKLAHGLHQTGLGTFNNGEYSINLSDLDKWERLGGINSGVSDFVVKFRITKGFREWGASFSRSIYWMLTGNESIPEQVVRVANRVNLYDVMRLGIKENGGRFTWQIEDTLRDILPYEPEIKYVVDILKANPRIDGFKKLYVALRDDAVKKGILSKEHQGRVVIPNYLSDSLVEKLSVD